MYPVRQKSLPTVPYQLIDSNIRELRDWLLHNFARKPDLRMLAVQVYIIQ